MPREKQLFALALAAGCASPETDSSRIIDKVFRDCESVLEAVDRTDPEKTRHSVSDKTEGSRRFTSIRIEHPKSSQVTVIQDTARDMFRCAVSTGESPIQTIEILRRLRPPEQGNIVSLTATASVGGRVTDLSCLGDRKLVCRLEEEGRPALSSSAPRIEALDSFRFSRVIRAREETIRGKVHAVMMNPRLRRRR